MRTSRPMSQTGGRSSPSNSLPPPTDESLTGDLQPLRLSFASDTVVYPMRLSRSANTPQTVDLYVLADHRMDPTSLPVPGNAPTLEFAGRIEGTDVSPALADFVGDGAFLTRWHNDILEPASIDGDYVFENADADTEYQRVIYQTRNRGDLTGLTLLALVGVCGVMIVIALIRRRDRLNIGCLNHVERERFSNCYPLHSSRLLSAQCGPNSPP